MALFTKQRLIIVSRNDLFLLVVGVDYSFRDNRKDHHRGTFIMSLNLQNYLLPHKCFRIIFDILFAAFLDRLTHDRRDF